MTPDTLFPVSFNLTYACPEGQVFDADWFATPFVLLTCRDNGAFDPVDWTIYQCVLRECRGMAWCLLSPSIPSFHYRVLRLHNHK